MIHHMRTNIEYGLQLLNSLLLDLNRLFTYFNAFISFVIVLFREMLYLW